MLLHRSLRSTPILAFFLVLARTPSPAAAQEIAFPQLAADAAAGTGLAEACALERLVGTARCGVFRVYEDRDARAGRTIDIAFVVLEALDAAARRSDGIIMLPGGPGQAFTDAAVPFSRGMPELRRERDIVLVDVRGVGRSASLSCAVVYPGGFASRFGALFPLDHTVACRDALAEVAALDRYTTAVSVDDIEDLRAWLGYTSWNLIGGSYGTRVAQVYMRRHPAAVRTVVLNGVATITEPLYVQHAFLLQRALDRLLDECGAHDECVAAFPDLGDRLGTLLGRFRDGPLDLDVNGERVRFSAGDVAYALRGLLYGQAAALPLLIRNAADGDIAPLAEYYAERTAWVGEPGGEAGYHLSVLCAEDIAAVTDEHVERWTRDTFMGATLIDSYVAACALWPHARLPVAHFEPVRSEAPTLLLSGGRDPVTPPESAEAVAAHLPNSVHVVVPNGGHGVGGPCVAAMIVRLVQTASVAGIDTSCIEAVPPTRFLLPASR
jgi:pimeloyl-ACP methyl ester carboxylesterase